MPRNDEHLLSDPILGPALLGQQAGAEALAALKAHEAWEADIILNANWSGETPRLTQQQCDALIDVQAKRNAALRALEATLAPAAPADGGEHD